MLNSLGYPTNLYGLKSVSVSGTRYDIGCYHIRVGSVQYIQICLDHAWLACALAKVLRPRFKIIIKTPAQKKDTVIAKMQAHNLNSRKLKMLSTFRKKLIGLTLSQILFELMAYRSNKTDFPRIAHKKSTKNSMKSSRIK